MNIIKSTHCFICLLGLIVIFLYNLKCFSYICWKIFYYLHLHFHILLMLIVIKDHLIGNTSMCKFYFFNVTIHWCNNPIMETQRLIYCLLISNSNSSFRFYNPKSQVPKIIYVNVSSINLSSINYLIQFLSAIVYSFFWTYILSLKYTLIAITCNKKMIDFR